MRLREIIGTVMVREIYVWGVSQAALILHDCINIVADYADCEQVEIAAYIDGDYRKRGKTFLDKKVMEPGQLEYSANAMIVVALTLRNTKQVYAALAKKGFRFLENYCDAGSFLLTVANGYCRGSRIRYADLLKRLIEEGMKCPYVKNEAYGIFSNLVSALLAEQYRSGKRDEEVASFLKKIRGNWFYDKGLKQFCELNAVKLSDASMISADTRGESDCGAEELYFLGEYNVFIRIADEWCAYEDAASWFSLSLAMADKMVRQENTWVKEYIGLCQKQKRREEIQEKLLRGGTESAQSFSEDDYLGDVIGAIHGLDAGQMESAERHIDRALQENPFNELVCGIRGKLHFLKGEYEEAIRYYARTALKNAGAAQTWMITDDGRFHTDPEYAEKIKECLEKCQNNGARYAKCLKNLGEELLVPRKKWGSKRFLFEEGKIVFVDAPDLDKEIVVGEDHYIGGHTREEGLLKYLAARHCKSYQFSVSGQASLLSVQRENMAGLCIAYKGNEIVYDPQLKGEKLSAGTVVDRFPINRWTDLHVDAPLRISSEERFFVSNPYRVRTGKTPRVVINLFLDALAFRRVKENMGRYMPNTADFFSKGCIFQNCYAVAEWTQTCYPSMFTGIRPSRLWSFHPRIVYPIPVEQQGIAEQMNEQGYYCVHYSADSGDMRRFGRMGVCRGYHEHQVENDMPLHYAIHDVMYKMQEMDAPLFFNIHNLDIHECHFDMGVTATRNMDASLCDYERLLLNDSLDEYAEYDYSDLYRAREEMYLKQIQQADWELHFLYDYLERNFDEKDFFVILHSDHGGRGGKFHLCREHTNIAMMLRGYETPQKGAVKDEIVSGLDLYALYAKILGFKRSSGRDAILPRVFGGRGREYAMTQWYYPGQKFRLAINTLQDEFWFETEKDVSYDGKIDPAGFHYWLLRDGIVVDTREEAEKINVFLQRAMEYIRDINRL